MSFPFFFSIRLIFIFYINFCRAKNKLDGAVYAVKKVFVKINKENIVLKILREVTVLAKVEEKTSLLLD